MSPAKEEQTLVDERGSQDQSQGQVEVRPDPELASYFEKGLKPGSDKPKESKER